MAAGSNGSITLQTGKKTLSTEKSYRNIKNQEDIIFLRKIKNAEYISHFSAKK